MIVSLLIIAATFAADDAQPPPLTADQLQKVRALVQRTQAEHAAARQSLAKVQEELARCYEKYDLDEQEVVRLQAEIVEQQRKLLATHHQMHKELRTIVGAERFLMLSKRIENSLKSPAVKPEAVSPSQK